MKKSLFDSNPYLKNPKKYRKALILNVASSTSVETGAPVNTIIEKLTKLNGDIDKPNSKINH